MTDKEFEQVVFEFIDSLGETKLTINQGYLPYICMKFNLNVKEGREFLAKWIDTFEERHKENEN